MTNRCTLAVLILMMETQGARDLSIITSKLNLFKCSELRHPRLHSGECPPVSLTRLCVDLSVVDVGRVSSLLNVHLSLTRLCNCLCVDLSVVDVGRLSLLLNVHLSLTRLCNCLVSMPRSVSCRCGTCCC